MLKVNGTWNRPPEKKKDNIGEFHELILKMSVIRHYCTCIILKGQYQHLSILWTEILSSSYCIWVKFICIQMYVYIFKYYFYLNKLSQIFLESIQNEVK